MSYEREEIESWDVVKPPPGTTYQWVRLDASPSSRLDWKIEPSEAWIVWDLDLGLFERLPLPLDHPGQLQALIFALTHFRDHVWRPHQKRTAAVNLYHGPLLFPLEGDFFERRNQVGHFLSTLAAALPDLLPKWITFTDTCGLQPFEIAAILHPAAFRGIELPQPETKEGVCLPPLEAVDWSDWKLLSPFLERPMRFLPSGLVTGYWDGLDHLYYLPKFLTPNLQRQLLGFKAAGGILIDIT